MSTFVRIRGTYYNINTITSIKNTGTNGENRYCVVVDERFSNNVGLSNLTHLSSDNVSIVTVSSLDDILQ